MLLYYIMYIMSNKFCGKCSTQVFVAAMKPLVIFLVQLGDILHHINEQELDIVLCDHINITPVSGRPMS